MREECDCMEEHDMEWNKRVVVAGAGKSGIGAARLLLEQGAEVIVFDENDKVDKLEVLQKLGDYEKAGVVIGKLDEALLDTIDLMIISPGISIEAKFTEAFREREIPIWSEIELAYRIAKGSIAAITGTNGKTTTTALVGEICKAYQEDTYVVGNIGLPFTQIAGKTTENSLIVAEISSFQLETIQEFKPKVSAVLNVTPDHLDRHHTFECYRDTKQKITMNQTKEQFCVLNYDDEQTRQMGDQIPAASVYFSRLEELEEGICLQGDQIVIRRKQMEDIPVLSLEERILLGNHNIENYMAAIAIAYYMGIPVEVIRRVCKEFKGVEHRIEFVKEVRGVRYYNDSKGTNPDAAIKGIQAMDRPTLLIGGGYDKHVGFDEWIESFEGKVRWLLLIGQTAEQIAQTARKHGFENILLVENLKEAVGKCYSLAEEGEAVLLSPACASWGQFDNYEQRGNLFKTYVEELPE